MMFLITESTTARSKGSFRTLLCLAVQIFFFLLLTQR